MASAFPERRGVCLSFQSSSLYTTYTNMHNRYMCQEVVMQNTAKPRILYFKVLKYCPKDLRYLLMRMIPSTLIVIHRRHQKLAYLFTL